MLPKYHIFFGLIFSALICFIFPSISFIGISIIFLSSLFIDLDHYIHYAIKKKDISLLRAYKWYKSLDEHHKPIMQIFHTFEFLVIFALVSYFTFYYLRLMFIGLVFHSFTDLVNMYFKHKFSNREFFFFKYIFSKDKRKYL